MRIAALVDHRRHVCCRYRIAAFESHWAAHGVAVDFFHWPRTSWGRVSLYRRLRGRIILLQRRLLPRYELWMLRRSASRLIFDFDDAVWLRDSYSSRGMVSAKRAGRFAATIQASDLIIAGNSFLADHARELAADGMHRIRVIPTCVESSISSAEQRQHLSPLRLLWNGSSSTLCDFRSASSPLTLVWIGSSSTLRGFERLAAVLDELTPSLPPMQLKLICDRFIKLKRMPVIPVRWAAETEWAEIASSDIGLAWNPDDDWSRGKCGLKVLQYFTAGLPVVANPVGVHQEIVGDAGRLASDPAEWHAALTELAQDADLRRRLGANGRRFVHDKYSVEVGARLWIDSLLQWRREAA